jgi:tetratricopeptide (TPR) repeat protein
MKTNYLLFILLYFCLACNRELEADRYYEKAIIAREDRLAIKYYTKAIELGYKPIQDTYRGRAYHYCEISKYEKAINDYDIILNIEPDSYIYVARGVAKFELKKYEDAIKDFNMSIHLDKQGDWKSYVYLGYCNSNLGKYEQALKYYDSALIIYPDDPLIGLYKSNTIKIIDSLNQRDTQ